MRSYGPLGSGSLSATVPGAWWEQGDSMGNDESHGMAGGLLTRMLIMSYPVAE